MPEVQQESFDYDSLDDLTRELIQQKTMETHGLMKRTAEHIIQIGQNLSEVQQHLPAMKFSEWLRAEFSFSRQSAYNFIKVAAKFSGSCKTVLQLPAKILYELASASDEIIQHVETGEILPTLDAIKTAKEAERHAKEAERQAQARAESIQKQLVSLNAAAQEKQDQIEQLSQEITRLKEHIETQAPPTVEIREVEKFVVPPEVQAQMENVQEQLHAIIQQRDALAQQVTQLGEEAKEAARRQDEEEQERSVRLNWYKVTREFRASIAKILSQWPSPLDTLAFEADDWTRLSQTKDLARRFLEECSALTQEKFVDDTSRTTEKGKMGEERER